MPKLGDRRSLGDEKKIGEKWKTGQTWNFEHFFTIKPALERGGKVVALLLQRLR